MSATQTPWGRSEHARVIAEGIVFHSTASHGGFKLSAGRLAEMPGALRRISLESKLHGPGGWFEEDCEAAAVVFGFPQLFPPEQVQSARRMLAAVYPAAFSAPRVPA